MKRLLAAFVVTLGLAVYAQATCDHRTTTCFTAADVSGALSVGSLSNTGSSTVTGNVSVTGNNTVSGKTIFPRTTTTGVTISTTIPSSATFEVVTSTSPGATILVTATPSITAGTDGQYLVLKGTSSLATVTLQDNGTLAGSTLELGAASRVISDVKVLTLIYDATVTKWVEVSYGNN